MLTGYIQIILALILFASSSIYVRFITLPAPLITFYRFSFAVIALIIFLKFRKESISIRPLIKNKLIAMIGITVAFANVLFFYALQFTTIANGVILHNTAPIFVALLAPFLLKEKVERKTIIALIISFIGIIFIASPQHLSYSYKESLGVVAGLLSGILYALYIIISKKLQGFSPFQINYLQFLIGVLLLSPFLLLMPHTVSLVQLSLLFVMGVINTAVAFTLFFHGMKSIKAQHVGILSYGDPFFAILFAFVIFREIPSLNTIIGGIFVIIGIYIIMRKRKP